MKTLIEKTARILLFLLLIVLEICYANIIVSILQSLNIDINTFPKTIRTIIIIGIYLSLLIIFYLIYHKRINKDLKDYLKNFKKYFTIGISKWAIGLGIMFVLNIILFFVVGDQSTNETSVQTAIIGNPIYMLFATIIYAPIIEELIYRKALHDVFKNDILFIIMAGLIFGFIHVIDPVLNGDYIQLLYILPYGSMGSILAYIYVKTKNITVPMSIHMLHNTILLILSLISNFLVS